jgi:hypothetical protein
MLRIGFETTTPAFVRAKTLHVLDRATTVISLDGTTVRLFISEELPTKIRTRYSYFTFLEQVIERLNKLNSDRRECERLVKRATVSSTLMWTLHIVNYCSRSDVCH